MSENWQLCLHIGELYTFYVHILFAAKLAAVTLRLEYHFVQVLQFAVLQFETK